jgi:hypothetical protein
MATPSRYPTPPTLVGSFAGVKKTRRGVAMPRFLRALSFFVVPSVRPEVCN